MRQTDILVIGGGILGCAAAYYLAKRNLSVVLVDKGPLASEATGATTAGLTLQNRAPERLPLFLEAGKRWQSLESELEADLGYSRCGSVAIADTPDEFSQRKAEVAALQALGLEIELLTPTEARELIPWITSELAGASYCPVDGFAEPALPPQAFAQAAERHGASLLSHYPVEALSLDGRGGFQAITPHGSIRAKRVVNAAGAWAGKIAAMLDVELPISLDPLHAMVTESRPPWLDKVVLHVTRKLTLKQNRNGRVMIGGGWQGLGDLESGPKGLKPENRAANLKVAYAAVPQLTELKIEDSWVGLEGRSPDRLPFFGEVATVPGFYVLACAHGGYTLSSLLGDQLAELIVEGHTSFPMNDFTCREFLAGDGRK